MSSQYDLLNKIKEGINNTFMGKEDVVEKVLICLLAEGHVLLEDVPGVGKTTLAKTLAKVIGCTMGRIQFTPDTLPGDVTGMSVYDMKTGEFQYREGAVMKQILLADEINRTAPKTQASLLEAMAERQVTVDGNTYTLPKPFMVIATQNPVEFLGTYPLPEAQMDRFMMRIFIGYPGAEEEVRMAKELLKGNIIEATESVCGEEQICELMDAVSKVRVSDSLIAYAKEIVELTRQEESFLYGISPRGLLELLRAARAKAFLEERDFVKPDDVKAVVHDVLIHRLPLTSEAKMRKVNVRNLISSLLTKVKVPV